MDEKRLVKYFYEEIVSKHRLDELTDYIAPQCTLVSGEERVFLGVEGMRAHLNAVRETYPDYTMSIVRQWQEGATVISEFVMTGTHEGAWLGMVPSHKRLVFTGVDIDTVLDGKIIAHGGAVNTFETLLTHGLIRPNDTLQEV